MQTKRIQKDVFAVIGKAGEGATANSKEWIPPLWQEANTHFNEIAAIAKKDENGVPLIWGAMNDVTENNKMWGERGKYMVGCEADIDAEPPAGWQKWIVPAQTYLVAECTQDTYGEVFSSVVNDPNIKIVATVHERYPQPSTGILELWFPIEVEGK
ncbi:MAG: GyrI-like domain-containing protein [Oscillospiraceae bacterium]|nr:GyrI-like domain-containing protein [Oscillospiraceae bacterium]